MMQNRRVLLTGMAGSFVATAVAAKQPAEAEERPEVCPRCGRIHGKLAGK